MRADKPGVSQTAAGVVIPGDNKPMGTKPMSKPSK